MSEWEAWLYSAATGQLAGWQQWRDYASTALDRCKPHSLCKGTHDYLTWVQEQASSNYCRGLYRWTKGAEPILPRTVKSPWAPEVLSHPQAIAEHHRLQWKQYWCKDPGNVEDLVHVLADTAASARALPRRPFRAADITAALYTFKDETALGADGLSPLHFKCLPPMGIQAFCDLVNLVCTSVAWPYQVLCNKMVLKAKPRGGERTLALFCMFAWITTRLFRGQTRAWTAAKARHWDHAIAGSSALRSAVLQALRKELAIAHGHQWAVLLWDLAKFYDSIDLLILCAMAHKVHGLNIGAYVTAVSCTTCD